MNRIQEEELRRQKLMAQGQIHNVITGGSLLVQDAAQIGKIEGRSVTKLDSVESRERLSHKLATPQERIQEKFVNTVKKIESDPIK